MITINGKTYHGNNVSIVGNRVIIDGVDQTPDAKNISIQIEGNITNLNVDYADNITVNGNVDKMKSGSGNVKCGHVGSTVETGSGNVEAAIIRGDVKTGSGNVKSDNIEGSVKTSSGNIKYIK